jgi:uncharacterized protein YjbI with pentapeptide repeats
MNQQNPSDNLPDGLKPILYSFAALEQIKDPIYREYELIQYAKRYDLPIDSFRQMFNDYCRQQQEAKWKQSPVTALIWRIESSIEWFHQSLRQMDLFPVLDYLSKLSVIVALIVYVTESGEREEQKVTQQRRANYEAWSVIRANENKLANGGRIDALQDLNKQEPKISLAGINLTKGYLSTIQLPGAVLDGAVLNDAMLNGANLKGAYLTNSNLHEANLIGAELQNAFLYQTNLRSAVLSEANLTGAIMSSANLMGANLKTAILNKVKLTGAIYDSETVFPPNFIPSQYGAILLKPGANLQSKDLSAQDLSKIDFSQTDLKGALLCGANLQSANLENANLMGADLERADLRKAKGLNITQIKQAKNWKFANYDPSFRQQLGLSPID